MSCPPSCPPLIRTAAGRGLIPQHVRGQEDTVGRQAARRGSDYRGRHPHRRTRRDRSPRAARADLRVHRYGPKRNVLAVLRNAGREERRHRHVSPPREQCKGVVHQRPYRASPTMEDLRRPGVPSRPGVCGLLPLHAARRARDGAGDGARLLPQDRLVGLQRSVPLDGRDERADDEVHQRTVSRDSPRTRTAHPGRTHHPGRPPQLRLHGDDGIRVDGAAASTRPTGTSSTCSTSLHRRPP